MVNATSLNSATQKISFGNDALVDLFIKNKGQEETKANEAAAIARETGAAKGRITQTEGEAGLATQRAKQLAADTYGTDISDPNNRIASLALQGKDEYERAVSILDTISQKQSVGFFDNPLEYIVNQLSLPDDQEAYSLAARKSNMALAEADSINQSTQIQQQTQANLTKTLTAQSVADKVKVASAELEIAALELEVKGLAANTEGAKFKQAASQQALDNQYKVFSAQQAEAHLRLSQEAAADARAQRKLVMDAKDEDVANDVILATWITRGMAASGAPGAGTVYTPKMWKTEKTFLTAKRKAELEAFADIGRSMGANGTSPRSLGASPGEVAVNVVFNNHKLGAGQETLHKAITDAASSVNEEAVGKGVKVTPEMIQSNVNVRLRSGAKDMARNVEQPVSGFSDNIYKGPKTAELLDKFPVIEKSKLYQEVIAPLRAATKDGELPAKMVFATALEAIREGKLTLNEAVAETKNYYGNIVKYNNIYTQYTSVGMEQQKSYTVKVPFVGGPRASLSFQFSQTKEERKIASGSLDAADESQIRIWFIQNIVDKRFEGKT